MIDNLIVHYAIDDATNEITIVTEAVRFDINHCLLIPDRFYHTGVVATIGIRTHQLTTFLCCSCDNPKRKERISVRISSTNAESSDLWVSFVASFAASIDSICEDLSFLGTKILEYKPSPGLKLSFLV